MKKLYVSIITVFFLLIAAGCGDTVIYEPAVPEPVENPNVELNIVEEKPEEAKLYISILGEVIRPGVYIVSEGSRMFEAINLAGGITEEADVSSINLVEFVEDGMQITVPSVSGSYVNEGNAEILTNHTGKVNINKADISELKTLEGIGDTRAAAIVDYRSVHGKFNKIEDIMNVSGIKESIFEKIKDDIYTD